MTTGAEGGCARAPGLRVVHLDWENVAGTECQPVSAQLCEEQRGDERRSPSPTASAFRRALSQEVTLTQPLPRAAPEDRAASSLWPGGCHPQPSRPALCPSLVWAVPPLCLEQGTGHLGHSLLVPSRCFFTRQLPVGLEPGVFPLMCKPGDSPLVTALWPGLALPESLPPPQLSQTLGSP